MYYMNRIHFTRPVGASASSWIIEDELKVYKTIQNSLESNTTLSGSKAVDEARILFRSCTNACILNCINRNRIATNSNIFLCAIN